MSLLLAHVEQWSPWNHEWWWT